MKTHWFPLRVGLVDQSWQSPHPQGLVAREENPKSNGSNLPTVSATSPATAPTSVVSVSRGSVRLVSSGLTERRVEAPRPVFCVEKVGLEGLQTTIFFEGGV